MFPKVGDSVELLTPDNPRLHGGRGVVDRVEQWGAHVLTPSAATGRFRALWQEIRLLDINNSKIVAEQTVVSGTISISESTTVVADSTLSPTPNHTDKQSSKLGFTGNVCDICGGCKMIRNGKCELCLDCGATTGCS